MPREPQISTYNYLIRQLPTATAFINKKFEVVHASDKWVSYHQLDTANIIGTRIDTLFTKLDDQREKLLRDCLMGKSHEAQVDYNINLATGHKWFEWNCKPWYDEKENIIGLIIQTEDITENKLDQHRLYKAQSLLSTIAEVSKIGCWEYDIVQDDLSWCEMTRKIHEVSEDFVPTIENALDFYKDGYSKNTMAMLVHEAKEKGTSWSEKLQLVTAKGNEIWVQAACMPMFKNKKLISLTGTFQNIDDQIRSEAKTKENERLLRTLVDNLPLNIYIKDSESRKILVNKAECDYLGVANPEELLGKNDFDLYDKEIAQISLDEDIKVMDTLTPMLGRETISRKKNGEITTFLTSKIPLKDNNGRAKGLVGISLDISNLKQKEEELRNLINITSLQNKKLVNFAHIVSHNLRSHTANFSMLLEFLVNESDESEKKKIINMLTDASDNLLETLENLNQVVDINTNVNLQKKPINLYSKINEIEQNLTAFFLNNNATILNHVSKKVEVHVVASYIDSILMNFITNAVKYKNPEIDSIVTLSTTNEKGYTILSITDNGLGINLKKYGDKLFGMYKTFHNHADARGIGLFITKSQIEAMGGKVTVQSEVGKGTTFNIYFNEKN